MVYFSFTATGGGRAFQLSPCGGTGRCSYRHVDQEVVPSTSNCSKAALTLANRESSEEKTPKKKRSKSIKCQGTNGSENNNKPMAAVTERSASLKPRSANKSKSRTKKFKSAETSKDDAPCMYCASEAKPGEHFICCQECLRWAHTECAGLSNKDVHFVCDMYCQ